MFSVRLSVVLLGCTALACGETSFGSDVAEPAPGRSASGVSGSSGRSASAGASAGLAGAASGEGQAGGQAGGAGNQASVPVGGQAGVTGGGKAGASGEAGAATGGQAGENGGQPGSDQAHECDSDDDCAVPASPCQVALCTAEHVCATKPGAAGKVVSVVNEGCTFLACDGQGSLTIALPEPGTSCGGGGYCNDQGTCGECAAGLNQCVEGGQQRSCSADGHWSAPVSCGGMPCGAASGECVGVQQVSVGGAHACALLADGTVRCWGDNASGQLGPAPVAGHAPREVPGLKDIVKVTTGHDFSCALSKAGTVSCWGAADMGQLGVEGAKTGTMQTIEDIVFSDLSSSGWHSCGVVQGGVVACWGDNSTGQTGLGGAIRPTPAFIQELVSSLGDVKFLAGVRRVVTGEMYGCALAQRGTGDRVFCWGDNSHGQLSKKTSKQGASLDVTAAMGTTTILSIVGGPSTMSFSFHDPALKTNQVSVWGDPGVAKGASTSTYQVQPWFQEQEAHEVALGTGVSAIVSPGEISFYGNNLWGQFGNGASSSLDGAQWTLQLPDAEHVALGARTACAWSATGKVWCWGKNADGIVVPSTASFLVLPPTLLAWLGRGEMRLRVCQLWWLEAKLIRQTWPS